MLEVGWGGGWVVGLFQFAYWNLSKHRHTCTHTSACVSVFKATHNSHQHDVRLHTQLHTSSTQFAHFEIDKRDILPLSRSRSLSLSSSPISSTIRLCCCIHPFFFLCFICIFCIYCISIFQYFLSSRPSSWRCKVWTQVMCCVDHFVPNAVWDAFKDGPLGWTGNRSIHLSPARSLWYWKENCFEWGLTCSVKMKAISPSLLLPSPPSSFLPCSTSPSLPSPSLSPPPPSIVILKDQS